MLQAVATVLLLVFDTAWAENTSTDRVEQIPVVNRFSPDSNILQTGRQVLRDVTESKGIVKVADNFYEEYFYDNEALVSPKPQNSIVRTTLGSTEGTTMESAEGTTAFEKTEGTAAVVESAESTTVASAEPATTILTVAPAFATLLVSPVPFHPTSTAEATTRSAPRPAYLRSGDVFHAKLDETSDEFSPKHIKKTNWRRIWKSLRPKKRTIVSNTVGVVPDNLPPPPPGAVFIEIPQVRARRKTNRDSREEGTNSQEEYPIPITKDRIFLLPSRARPLRRIDTQPLAITAPISSPLASNYQLSDSYFIYRKKFDQALQALNSVEDDVDLLDADSGEEKHSKSHLGHILKLVTI